MTNSTNGSCGGPGYASPQDAIQAPREKVVYTICIYTGTGIEKPDYLATIDTDRGQRHLRAGDQSTEHADHR